MAKETMIDEDCFHTNLQMWARENPQKALFIPYIDEESLTFTKTAQGELNLQKTIDGKTVYYHNQESAKKEAEEWFASLDLRIAEVIYVYGIGLGHYYKAAKEWLEKNPKRAIVFLEDDLAVLHRFFQTELATEMLENPQVRVQYFRDLKDWEDLFFDLYWDYVLTQMTVSGLLFYQKNKTQNYEELTHKIVYDSAIKNALVEEYLRFGTSFFINFYHNMLWLSESWKGNHMYDKFKNIPAIICGAGPSLMNNIDILHNYKDNAIIFGGGSSLNALSSHDILPHFGIGIDPNPTQQFRLSTNKAYEVPLFYRNRMHYEAFRMIHGPRLYISGAGGYDVSDLLDEKYGVKEEEYVDEGHNVVNFGLELANRMGCNPIIFVGVDLAYTDMQAYAQGVVDEDVTVKTAEILNTDDFDTQALLKTDVHGKPIYTLWKWIAESNWIGEYQKEHPHLTVVNCTEGGLGMPGIPNMTLKEAAEKFFTTTWDLNTRVQGEILNSELPEITEERVFNDIKELGESVTRSKEHLEELINDSKRLQRDLMEKKEVPKIIQSGLAALAETELTEESAYEYILDIFNLVYSRILNREIHKIQALEGKEAEWELLLKRTNINLNRLTFLLNVAAVNEEIIKRALHERLEYVKK